MFHHHPSTCCMPWWVVRRGSIRTIADVETFEDQNHDMASNEASNEALECDDCASDLDSVPAEHVLELPRGGTN